MPSFFSLGDSASSENSAAESQTTLVPEADSSIQPSADCKIVSDESTGIDPAAKKARLAELQKLAKDKKEAGESPVRPTGVGEGNCRFRARADPILPYTAARQEFLRKRAEKEAKSGNAFYGTMAGAG